MCALALANQKARKGTTFFWNLQILHHFYLIKCNFVHKKAVCVQCHFEGMKEGERVMNVLKNCVFCKVDITIFSRKCLNNRKLFRNLGYCGVAKMAVILHPIKNAPFLRVKNPCFVQNDHKNR